MGSSEPAAGYLAPPEFVAKIATYLTLASPIRSVATVYNTNSRRLQIPVQTANAAAAATAEGSANTEDTAMTFAVVNVNTFNIVVNRGVTTEMLYSSAINLEDHLVREFGKAIAKTEGTMFVSGNGSTQPEGIMTNASITYAASGDADEVTAAGIIKAFYKLPEDYARNATWAMRRTTLGKIRTFTDGSGNYLWQPALGELSPPTLLGRPYIECPDMPDEGSGTYPIIVGDFAAGYAIADLNQLEIVRDPYTYATSSIIRFIARRLTGGAVVLPEAFVKVKCATS